MVVPAPPPPPDSPSGKAKAAAVYHKAMHTAGGVMQELGTRLQKKHPPEKHDPTPVPKDV